MKLFLRIFIGLLVATTITYIGIMGVFVFVTGSTPESATYQYNIDTFEEFFNFITFRCSSSNAGDILYCQNYDGCNFEIPNKNEWKTYKDLTSMISFSYPPGAVIQSNQDHILISNIKLSENSSIADSLRITKRRLTFNEASQEAETSLLDWTPTSSFFWSNENNNHYLASSYFYPPSGRVFLVEIFKEPKIGWFEHKYVYIEEYLQEEYGDKKMDMLQISGTNHEPAEWGKMHPQCMPNPTPAEAVYYSIRY